MGRAGRSVERAVRRVGRGIGRIGRELLPVAGAVVGGALAGPAGVGLVTGALAGAGVGSVISSATDKPKMPSINIDTQPIETADPSLSTPTTPENSPIQAGGNVDATDTGLGDVTSIFSSLTKQEDEWDKFLGRYSKK